MQAMESRKPKSRRFLAWLVEGILFVLLLKLWDGIGGGQDTGFLRFLLRLGVVGIPLVAVYALFEWIRETFPPDDE